MNAPATPQTPDRLSVEQMCRNLLEQAILDGLVSRPPRLGLQYDPHPQARTSGELAGVANLLAKYLAESRQK